MNGAFSAALRVLKADARGRINIGTVVADAGGRQFEAAVDAEGRILLTPVPTTGRAVE